MNGVLLAGGRGGRLHTVTDFKPLAEVGDRPMLDYPAQTLEEMGCEVTVVTSPTGMERLDSLDYPKVLQPEPRGMPDAIGRTSMKGLFAVMAGDFFFDPAPEVYDVPTLYWAHTDTPKKYGIYDPDTNRITEKPSLGSMAILAVYLYDERIYDIIKTLKPGSRGETEITDLNNKLLEEGIQLKEYRGFWGDMGTPKGLKRVERYLCSL